MRISRAKAIRLKCLDCCGEQQAEARRCSIKTCALWRFRMGREEHDEMYQPRKPKEKNANMLDDLEDT